MPGKRLRPGASNDCFTGAPKHSLQVQIQWNFHGLILKTKQPIEDSPEMHERITLKGSIFPLIIMGKSTGCLVFTVSCILDQDKYSISTAALCKKELPLLY